MRDRLIELMKEAEEKVQKTLNERFNLDLTEWLGIYADHLLENGVIVPPCKVGDKMYKLCTVNSRIKMGQMWDGRTVKNNCDRCGYRNCSCYDIGLRKHECETMIDVIEEKTITSLEFLIRIMPYVGTVWFNTKEEAEQKLKGGVKE